MAEIVTGPAIFEPLIAYTKFTGPTSFGSGGQTIADSGSGDTVGIIGNPSGFGVSVLAVPAGYTSGNFLSDSATYDNQTFASLGVTPGVYEWTWGTGTNQNFTLQIGPAAVLEPSALALLVLPLGLVMLAAARRAVCA